MFRFLNKTHEIKNKIVYRQTCVREVVNCLSQYVTVVALPFSNRERAYNVKKTHCHIACGTSTMVLGIYVNERYITN